MTQACAWLGIPRTTYYRCKASYRAKRKDDHVAEKIRKLCTQHKFHYGYREITALLRMEQPINPKRVQRIMQCEQLQSQVRVKETQTNRTNLHMLRNIC